MAENCTDIDESLKGLLKIETENLTNLKAITTDVQRNNQTFTEETQDNILKVGRLSSWKSKTLLTLEELTS